MENNGVDYQTYSNMQTGKPYRTYRKAIRANVKATVLNPFSGKPEDLILKGDINSPSSMVDTWSEKEDVFFKRANRVGLESGKIIAHTKPEDFQELRIEKFADATDEELITLLDGKVTKFFSFDKTLNEITNETVLFRLLNMARELEKSSKTISIIEKRLSEVQNTEQES